MNTVNVVLVVSHVNKSLQLEWMTERLIKKRIQLSFILLGESDTEFHRFLHDRNFRVHSVSLKGWLGFVTAFFRTVFILARNRPDVVHTHLYHANLIGLTAAWCLLIPKRILTRHHSTIHHTYYPKAVHIDRLINKLATHIVLPALSLRQTVVGSEGATPSKIRHIVHGFDLDYFFTEDKNAISEVSLKYKLSGRYPIVGAIARHTEWKGVQYVIPAFAAILKEFPNSHLVLANAGGDFHAEIAQLISTLPEAHYTVIGFESKVAALYHCFDFFVHVPIDPVCEAFGQTYIESLASGVPSIFTLSGIANEFIQDGVNALVVNYGDSLSIQQAIRRLLVDPALVMTLKSQGPISVREKFSIDQMASRLEILYTTGE